MRVDVPVLRELVESTVRPGQRGGSTTVDRMPSAGALAPRGHAAGNRYDWLAGASVIYGVYGRARYGAARYGHA